MDSIRQKKLIFIVFWCMVSILVFSGQAAAFPCSPEITDDLIKYGDIVTCTIGTIGDIDKFRFSGSDGDTVVVQATRQSSGIPCIKLFGPDGSLIASKCGGTAAKINVTLNQTGTHSILVSEYNNDEVMDFALVLERIILPSASATPINPCDPPLIDEIDPVGDLDLFFFQGSDGDTVVVQATRQSSGIPCIELFGPDGSLIASKCGGTAAKINVTLNQTGTHSILVSEYNNDEVIDYALVLERIIPPCPSAIPINPSDPPLIDEIDPVGDLDLFFFQGSDGDTVVVQATRQSSGIPCIELFGPDGSRIASKCGGTAAKINVTLNQTGTHSILVSEYNNDEVIDYALVLERIIPPCPSAIPINPSDPPLIDEIDPVGDLDLFFFQGSDGDTVVVQATRQSSGIPCIELFGPDGSRITSKCGGTAAQINVTLNQTGTHSILVSEYNNDEVIDYALVYECIGICPSTADCPNTFVYTPVTPCRIADTRKGGGIIGVSTKRNFRVFGSGSEISAQGGNSSGCPSPGGNPYAVHINMVAVDPTGKGNLQAFPVGAGTGTGLSVNYNTIDTNLANAGTVKTVTGSGPDITVASNFSSAHTVIDVLGYFYPDEGYYYTPVDPCRIVDTRKTSADIIDANTERDFRVYGPVSDQGGDSGGCPSTLSVQPKAAHINMVAVDPTGKGNLQAFPVGAGTGTGLSVNYNTIDTNLANAGTVKTVTGSGPDITVASNFSSAHTVIDVLGYYSEEEDLVYTPVKPCRIIDTRKAGGIIGASAQRNFRVFGSGSEISAQGGNSSGCPSPGGNPYAVHINMVAVDPTGKGNLQAFPVGAGTGTGLSVNYNTIDTNLANAGTVKTVTGSGPDITVASNFSSAHVVIDVLGYFYPAP